jgi:hypothetical protein
MSQEAPDLFTRLAPVLNVRDLAAERVFYERLGLPVIYEGPECWVDLPAPAHPYPERLPAGTRRPQPITPQSPGEADLGASFSHSILATGECGRYRP